MESKPAKQPHCRSRSGCSPSCGLVKLIYIILSTIVSITLASTLASTPPPLLPPSQKKDCPCLCYCTHGDSVSRSCLKSQIAVRKLLAKLYVNASRPWFQFKTIWRTYRSKTQKMAWAFEWKKKWIAAIGIMISIGCDSYHMRLPFTNFVTTRFVA